MAKVKGKKSKKKKEESSVKEFNGDAKRCPNCGRSIAADLKICPHCEADISEFEAEKIEEVGAEELDEISIERKQMKQKFLIDNTFLNIRLSDWGILVAAAMLLSILLMSRFYNWHSYFGMMNATFFTIAIIGAGISILILFLGGWFSTKKAARKGVFIAGVVLMALGIIGVIAMGSMSGSLGTASGLAILSIVGIYLMVIARREMSKIEITGTALFTIGALLIIFVPVNSAFQLIHIQIDAKTAGDVLVAGSNLFLLIGGIILIGIGLFILIFAGKFKAQMTSFYYIWAFGLASILIIPFHEMFHIQSTASYGPFDQTLAGLGGPLTALCLVVFLYGKWRENVITREIEEGDRYLQQGEVEKALESYDYVKSIDPDNFKAWIGEGVGLVRLRRLDEALVCINRALVLNPHSDLAWSDKGNIMSRQGRHDEAIDCYDKAIKLNPKLDIAWNNRGIALTKMGKFPEAKESLDKALEIKPDYAMALVNKGEVLANMGKLDEAKECYNKAKDLMGKPSSV